jgi:hypothetical protein
MRFVSSYHVCAIGFVASPSCDLFDRLHAKLIVMGVEQKSVTLTLDRLVNGDDALDDLMVICGFWFDEGAIVERLLFPSKAF